MIFADIIGMEIHNATGNNVELISRIVDSVTNLESSFLRLIAVSKLKFFIQLQYLTTSYNVIIRVP